MYYRDGLSLSAIARKTGYSRNTVKRWLKAAEGVESKYRRVRRDSKLAPYAAYLSQALESDARRPKWDRRSALKLLIVSVTFFRATTHHRFMADASQIGGELQRFIKEIGEAHPVSMFH